MNPECQWRQEPPTLGPTKGAVRDVVNWLGEKIVSDELKVGEILPMENDLGEMAGVSRTVVREAVKIVSTKGMVRTARRYGTVVCAREDWNLLDNEVLAWHKPGNPRSKGVLRELIALMEVVLPQALTASLGKTTDAQFQAMDAALGALENGTAPALVGEYAILAWHLDSANQSFFLRFKGMVYELLRLTHELEARDGCAGQGHLAPFERLVRASKDQSQQGMILGLGLIFERSSRLAS